MRLLFIIFSLLLISCSTSKVSVEKGIFRAIKSPNIYGNNRYLPKDTNKIISYDANIGRKKTIPLHGVVNEETTVAYDEIIIESPANINYRLIENTLGFQYSKVIKDEFDFYTGWGVGVQNFPYGVFMFGCNGENIEIGGSVLWGLTIDKASYDGYWYLHEPNFRGMFAKSLANLSCQDNYDHTRTCCDESGICHDYTEDEIILDDLKYIKIKDLFILHSYVSAAAYISYYWDKFAINYTASISNPWFIDDLVVNSEYYADISFGFPVLLMQDIGISYTPHKIKYRLGVNQITGIEFPGQYWGLSLQMAYLW